MKGARHSWKKILYRGERAAVLAGICLFTPFFGIPAVSWKHVLVLLGVLGLYAGVCLLPPRGKALCLSAAALCMGVAAAVGYRQYGDFLQAYVDWFLGRTAGRVSWLESFYLIQAAVLTAGAIAVQTAVEKLPFGKYILAFLLTGGMLLCLPARIRLTHMEVVFALLYVVMAWAERIRERRGESRGNDPVRHMLWLSPFLAVYFLLTALMPAPENPYDWQWAKELYRQVHESFLKVTRNLFPGGEDFDTGLSGFSESGKLGGSSREDDRELMWVRAGSQLAGNLYLTGKVYDTFDGEQWSQEYHGEEPERLLDTLETLYAAERLDRMGQGIWWDYLKETSLTVRYERFRTRYVFAPLKTVRLEDLKQDIDELSDGDNLISERKKGYGTEYRMSYYQMNQGQPIFDGLLELGEAYEEAAWEDAAGDFARKTGLRVSYEEMEAYRQRIYDNYLTGVSISGEIREYLEEVTKGAETDVEKLLAIERELSSYTYTREPGNLPEEVKDAGTFLDYFLLESRQGYCTYFATAFVLLARAEGIPARYVQGFCVPLDGNRETAVLSGMAHAWPEVYLEGAGWIPFEPTPGYGRLRYGSWGVAVEEAQGTSYEEPDENPGEPETDSLSEEPAERTQKHTGPEALKNTAWKQIVKLLAFVLLILLAFLPVTLALEWMAGCLRYRRMSPRQQLKVEFYRNMRILSWLGLRRNDQETLQELRQRGRLMEKMPQLRFIEDYEDVVYGGKAVEEEMLRTAKAERKALWTLLRKEKRRKGRKLCT